MEQNETSSKLAGYFLKQSEEIGGVKRMVLKEPELYTLSQRLKNAFVEEAVQQKQQTKYAYVKVSRDQTKVRIEWQLIQQNTVPERCLVNVAAVEIDLDPNPFNLIQGLVASTHGDGSCELVLEEGRMYSFLIFFYGPPNRDDEKCIALRPLTFHIGIPTSERTRTGKENEFRKPAQKVREEISRFLSVQDALDEMARIGIDRIKSRGLPGDEERQRLADFDDYIKCVKDGVGI